MTEAAITRYITETFPGVPGVAPEDNDFSFHDPSRMLLFANLNAAE